MGIQMAESRRSSGTHTEVCTQNRRKGRSRVSLGTLKKLQGFCQSQLPGSHLIRITKNVTTRGTK